MDILLRNINANVVKKIDELAKENKVSRGEFLKEELESIAYKKEINELEERYNSLMETLKELIITHTKIMGVFVEEYLIDPEDAFDYDLEEFLEEYDLDTFKDEIDDLKNKADKLSGSKIELDYNLDENSEIKIRNVPVDVLARIDEISESRNLSRNEFLNIYLRQLTYSDNLKLVDEKYDYMIEKTLGILHLTDRIMAIFKDENII